MHLSTTIPLKSYLLIFLVIFIWGSNFVFIKIGVGEIQPLMLLTLRFFLAGIIFLPFMKWPGLKQALSIASIGFLMGLLHQGFLYAGLTSMPAGMMSILLQSNVIMVTLIGLFFFKEKIGWRTWAGITVGIIGIIVLVGGPDLTAPIIGITYGLVSAFFIALAYIMMKHVNQVHPFTYIVLLHLPVTPFMVATSMILEGTAWIDNAQSLNWTIILSIVFYQAVILSISHVIWQKMLTRYPVSQIVPLTLLIPLFALMLSVPVLAEPVTPSLIIGGLLTILGVGIITLRKIQKKIL